MKRYKLTLTTDDGEVLETWNVCVEREAELGDEYNVANEMAARSLILDMRHEIGNADLRAKKLQYENPQWHSEQGRRQS